jgi:hypothetical protein
MVLIKLECELTETTWWKTCHAVAGLESWGQASSSNCSKEERRNSQSNAAGNWSYLEEWAFPNKRICVRERASFCLSCCQDKTQYLSLLIFRVSYRNFLNHWWYIHIWLDANLKIHHAHYQSLYELHQTHLWKWCTSTNMKWVLHFALSTLHLAFWTCKFSTSAL